MTTQDTKGVSKEDNFVLYSLGGTGIGILLIVVIVSILLLRRNKKS